MSPRDTWLPASFTSSPSEMGIFDERGAQPSSRLWYLLVWTRSRKPNVDLTPFVNVPRLLPSPSYLNRKIERTKNANERKLLERDSESFYCPDVRDDGADGTNIAPRFGCNEKQQLYLQPGRCVAILDMDCEYEPVVPVYFFFFKFSTWEPVPSSEVSIAPPASACLTWWQVHC